MTPVVFAAGATHTGGGIGGVCRGVGAVVSCVRSEVFSGPARGGRFLGLLHDGLSILGVGGGLFAGSNGAVGESFPEKRLCRTIVVRQSNGELFGVGSVVGRVFDMVHRKDTRAGTDDGAPISHPLGDCAGPRGGFLHRLRVARVAALLGRG